MTTISSGQSASFTLDAFGSITILMNGQGSMAAASRAVNLKSNVAVSVLQSKVYGPFGVPMDVVISCSDGSIAYTVTEGYGGSGASYLGTVADEAAMLALSGVSVGSVCYRTDTGTEWRCIALPSSSLGNWREGAAGSGGGGGGGGGDDVTDWGGFTDGNPGTVTINGVTQLIGRDGSGNIISYTIELSGADDIVTTISYDNGYAEASGNIIRGGAISMTAAQCAALKSEILDALGAAANGFKARVTGLFYRTTTAASTPIYHDGVLEWQNTRFRPVSGCAFDVWHNATHVNSSAESADLATVVLPRWLNKAGAQWRTTNLLSSAGGTAGTLATATKINGTTRGGGTSGSAVAATNCNILDIRCAGDAAQLFLPNGGSMISGTAVTGAALVETAIDSASTDITVTVTGTVNQTDKTITHRLTRVEMLA